MNLIIHQTIYIFIPSNKQLYFYHQIKSYHITSHHFPFSKMGLSCSSIPSTTLSVLCPLSPLHSSSNTFFTALYLSYISNLIFDCSFLRHTGQGSRCFFLLSSKWLLPFIMHLLKMQCLTPNMCPISCTMTPTHSSKIPSKSNSYYSSPKNLSSYLANEKTPVLSLKLATPKTKFHSYLW